MPITVDASLFAEDEDGQSDETVVLAGADDPAAAMIALQNARKRLLRVTERGVELDDEAFAQDSGDTYSPNYASDPKMSERGPHFYIDCKGFIASPMRDRFIAILLEELATAGVRDGALESLTDDDDYDDD